MLLLWRIFKQLGAAEMPFVNESDETTCAKMRDSTLRIIRETVTFQ